MPTIQVSIAQPKLDAPLSLLVAIPSLPEVIQLAKTLHTTRQPWEGSAFGWPADYTPEIKEENAVFEEYEENNVMHTVVAPSQQHGVGHPPAFVLASTTFGLSR